MTLQDAITQLEGTNPTYNNPGAISGTGDTGSSFGAGIGIYSSLDVGKAALDKQVQSILSGASPYYPSGMTVQQMGTTYSGGNTDYGNNLAKMMGVSPSTTLGQLSSTTGSTTGSNTWQKILGVMDGVGLGLGLPAAPSKVASGVFSLPSVQNIVVIVVGIIIIAAGLFTFKSTQTIISTGANLAKKGVAIATL